MSASLERRARQYRSRMLIRAWDYRQRGHARGVWFRLRRVLADASHAYAVSASDADRLRAEQYRHFRSETWLEERLAARPTT